MDLFQMEHALHYHHRITLIQRLKETDMQFPHCASCDEPVDMGWLRKLDDWHICDSICLPCFLAQFTNESQIMIDRMIQLGHERGFYKEQS